MVCVQQGKEILLLYKVSKLVLGHTKSRIQCTLAAFLAELKRPGPSIDHLSRSSVENRNGVPLKSRLMALTLLLAGFMFKAI
jgi:hypothetical protein